MIIFGKAGVCGLCLETGTLEWAILYREYIQYVGTNATEKKKLSRWYWNLEKGVDYKS